MKIVVLGDGAWGTTCANLIALNNYNVTLWCQNSDVVRDILASKINNKFLPHIKLDNKITPTTDLEFALKDADWIFEAIPVKYLRATINNCKNLVKPENTGVKPKWVILSKGIENDTLLLPSQIIQDVLGTQISNIAVLSGPSFAQDLAQKQITSVSLASEDQDLANQLKKIVQNKYFSTAYTPDIIGVQIAAALKNVIALALGLLDGAKYSENTKAFILTQGLREMGQIIKASCGSSHNKEETLLSLAGIGDLVLTATSSKSRNYLLGQKLAQSNNLETILSGTHTVPESINTVKSVKQIMEKHNLKLALFTNIHKIIFENLPISTMFTNLM